MYRAPSIDAVRQNTPTNEGSAGLFPVLGLVGVSTGGLGLEDKVVLRAASGLTDPVDSNMSDARVLYRNVQYLKGADFNVASGNIVWVDTKILSPYLKRASAVAGAGSLSAATYFYKIAAYKKTVAGTPGTYGYTLPSNEKSVTVISSGSKVMLEWGRVDLADGYRIYRSNTTGTETMLFDVVGGEVTAWEDLGVYTPSLVAMPSTNTASKRPPASVADTAGLAYGADASSNLAALAAVGNGSLSIALNGAAAVNIGSIVLTGAGTLGAVASAVQTAIRAALGTVGSFYSANASVNLATLATVASGGFRIAVDGAGAVSVGPIDFRTALTLGDCATLIQTAIRAATSGLQTCVYNAVTGQFVVSSATHGSTSSIAITAPTTPGHTDLTVATMLNFATGYAVAGADSAITCAYSGVTTNFIITSPLLGSSSSVVVTAGTTGTDLTAAALMYLVGGTSGNTVGTTGEKVYYDVEATIAGDNFYNPQTFYNLSDVAVAHGISSPLYAMAAYSMLPAPRGLGAPVICCCGVPDSSRGAFQAGLEDMAAVDSIEVILCVSRDIDVSRDTILHALYCSQDDVKKERIAVVQLPDGLTSDAYRSFAAGFNAVRNVVVVWDNQTNEPFMNVGVAAQKCASRDRAQSAIGSSIPTLTPVREAGRLNDAGTATLLSQGVSVVWSDNGNITLRDDVNTLNQDFPGDLVENHLRRQIRFSLNALKGRVKMLSRALDTCKEITVGVLDSFVGDEQIKEYDPATLVVSQSSVDPEGVDIEVEYVRMRTLKRIVFKYSQIG